jgi:hypothetical protein
MIGYDITMDTESAPGSNIEVWKRPIRRRVRRVISMGTLRGRWSRNSPIHVREKTKNATIPNSTTGCTF